MGEVGGVRVGHVAVLNRLLPVGAVAICPFADQQINATQERRKRRHRPRIGDEREGETSSLRSKDVFGICDAIWPACDLATLQRPPESDRDAKRLRLLGVEPPTAGDIDPVNDYRDAMLSI